MKSKMIGIAELVERIKKNFPEINKSQLKEVVEKLLTEIKSSLINNENILFKGNFGLKRGKTKPKGSKWCEKHGKVVENYKRVNKGKGIQVYSSSDTWRNLLNEAKDCKNCKTKKQQLESLAKPTNRIIFSPNNKFFEVSKNLKSKKR